MVWKFGQIPDEAKSVQYVFGISAAMQWLHLEKRRLGVELNRHVSLDQPKIDEERAEPAVGLDDALVTVESEVAGQVGRRAYQDAPVLGGLDHEAGPQLDDPGLCHCGEERRGENAL